MQCLIFVLEEETVTGILHEVLIVKKKTNYKNFLI